MRYFLILLCFLLSFTNCHADTADSLDYPDRFQIRQDRALRMFHIHDDKQFLGTVVNSDWGILDFYNSRKEKQYVNQEDVLYDNLGSCVGLVQFASYKEWFSKSSRIDIHSDKGELLAIVEPESDGRTFIFRDAETQEPLALAYWSQVRSSSLMPLGFWSQVNSGRLTPDKSNYSLQDWYVTVINRTRLQQKKISMVFLVWALLKHSQKHFPSPKEDCRYEVDFKQDNRFQDTTSDDPLFELSAIEFPEEFHIQQDSSLRLFRITANEKLLSIVANSKSEKFDFYDSRKRRQGVARVNSLYENSGHCIGFVELKTDSELLRSKSTSTLIKILSDNEVLLATMESEEGTSFVFRDAVTHEPLAIASWNNIKNTYLSWLGYDVKDWSVTILDPLRLREKQIPTVLLVWALLKHSEKHLPASWMCEYVDGPPID